MTARLDRCFVRAPMELVLRWAMRVASFVGPITASSCLDRSLVLLVVGEARPRQAGVSQQWEVCVSELGNQVDNVLQESLQGGRRARGRV